jgi:prepilin signal peptidase PulO-like enzyme (type II secretory pathway)
VPPSHSLYDNVPLLSWWMLRGRCRDCGTRIPIRYPLVELLAGLLFLTVALGEGLGAGHNLPLPLDAPRYFRWAPWQCWSLYAYHMLLLATLFTVTLFRFDREEPRASLFAPVLIVGGLGPLMLAWLQPVPLVPSDPGEVLPGWWALAGVVWGFGTGCAMGCCVWPVARRLPYHRFWTHPELLACAACGVVLGHQAVVAVVSLAAGAYLFAALVSRWVPQVACVPWSGYLTLGGLVFIMHWRPFVEWFPALGPTANWRTWRHRPWR